MSDREELLWESCDKAKTHAYTVKVKAEIEVSVTATEGADEDELIQLAQESIECGDASDILIESIEVTEEEEI